MMRLTGSASPTFSLTSPDLEGESPVRKLDSYVAKHGPQEGREMYYRLQREAALASAHARQKKRLRQQQQRQAQAQAQPQGH
jgi:hypothetical protein